MSSYKISPIKTRSKTPGKPRIPTRRALRGFIGIIRPIDEPIELMIMSIIPPKRPLKMVFKIHLKGFVKRKKISATITIPTTYAIAEFESIIKAPR